ncbi:hypothetical protein AtEden1_Chr4g0310991 [Arabidopsis thaliana]
MVKKNDHFVLNLALLSSGSKGFLILNLKPSNFLPIDNDKAILGDVGIPLLHRQQVTTRAHRTRIRTTISPLMGLSHELVRRFGSTIEIAIGGFSGRVKGKLPFKEDLMKNGSNEDLDLG